MRKIKVAVLCGGPGSEREVSLKSGAQVRQNLPRAKYDAQLVEIKADGRWLKNGRVLKLFGRDGRAKGSDLKKFDLVFNALHGSFGEDGRLQAFLETIGVPYTGSGVLASALGMNKLRSNGLAAGAGLNVPKTILLRLEDLKKYATTEKNLKSRLGLPLVVKPNESGSSVGVSIVRRAKDLRAAMRKALRESNLALAQKYIAGREMTCGVMGNAGDWAAALPPVEIISKAEFFDYEAKYNSGETREICPAPLPPALAKKLQGLAVAVHAALSADGLTRSDFILAKGKFYFLEINTSPGLTEASLCPKEARAAGMAFGEFLDRLCSLALQKFR